MLFPPQCNNSAQWCNKGISHLVCKVLSYELVLSWTYCFVPMPTALFYNTLIIDGLSQIFLGLPLNPHCQHPCESHHPGELSPPLLLPLGGEMSCTVGFPYCSIINTILKRRPGLDNICSHHDILSYRKTPSLCDCSVIKVFLCLCLDSHCTWFRLEKDYRLFNREKCKSHFRVLLPRSNHTWDSGVTLCQFRALYAF